MLDNIRIVLSHTSHPGNIGATARAMKNMGLTQLYLVNPKEFPHQKATERAVGADDLLENAQVVTDLEQALVGCELVLGCSARVRALAWPMLNPREAATKIFTLSKTCSKPVAILFGQEKAGLTNEELQRCQYHVYIPANEAYTSLNLASAVQVICYELRMALDLPMPEPMAHDEPASSESLEYFFRHLEETLIETRFLDPEHPKQLMPRLRRLFTRLQLEKMEVDLLRGMLTAFQGKRFLKEGSEEK
jgi:tRNA (cytidine32/uridine32-2'-O)-methyltransferase